MSQRNFFAELKRRNVIRSAGLYLVGAWLIVQVVSTVLPMFGAPAWLPRSIVLLLVIGFIPALVLSWAFELSPHGLKRDEDVPPEQSIAPRTARRMNALIIAVLVLALGYFVFDKFVLTPKREAKSLPRNEESMGTVPPSEPKDSSNANSVAVLPFVNMSSDKENDYFVDGLTEEILNRLAQISGLMVPGRTSSFAFKNKNTDLRQVGSALGVANLLEGSVRKAGERLRITAQLVRAADGYHIWSQTYDRKLDDVFAIQEEIARAIADALSVQLKVSADGKAEAPTQDMAAYGSYLEARALITQRTGPNLRRAIALLEGAVQRDPAFGKAWAALAQARALAMYYQVAPMKQSLEGAELAARNSLRIDDTIGLAHSALADVLRDRRDWLGSEREFRRALELSPSEAETHNQYAQMLLKVGHLDAALKHAQRACDLDPLAWVPPSIATLVELSRNNLDQARVWLDRTEQVRGKIDGFALRLELVYALSRHDIPEARRVLATARSSDAPEWSSAADRKLIEVMDQVLASASEVAHPPHNYRPALEAAAAAGEIDLPNEIAVVFPYVNQPQVALDILSAEMLSEGGDPAWIWTPPFWPLRKDPRFLQLLTILELPDYWRVAGWPTFCHPIGDKNFECVDK